jgi:hypothetical protein
MNDGARALAAADVLQRYKDEDLVKLLEGTPPTPLNRG